MAFESEGLLTALVLNAIITPLLLVFAYFVYTRKQVGRVMFWKIYKPLRPCDPPTFFHFGGQGKEKTKLWDCLFRHKDPWMDEIQGYEVKIYLTWLKLCMWMFLSVGCLLLATLIPVNASSGYLEEYKESVGQEYNYGVADWTTRNLPNESKKMWALMIISVIVATEVYGMVINMMQQFVRIKAKQVPPTSAVFRGFRRCKGDPKEYLLSKIPKDFHPSIEAIEIPRFPPDGMLEQMEEHENATSELEHWYAFCEKKEIHGEDRFTDKRLNIRQGWCSCTKVNAIKFYREKSDETYEKIVEMKKSIDDPELPLIGAAYITFDSPLACAKYVAEMNRGMKKMTGTLVKNRKVWFAPHPKCIVWANQGNNPFSLFVRHILTIAALVVLALLWGSIIAFLGNVDNLAEWIPFFDTILESNAEFRGFLTSYLPVIATAILNALVPKILRKWGESFEKIDDRKDREESLLKKMFAFSLVTYILLQAAAQGAGDSADILDNLDTNALIFVFVSMIVPTNGFFVVKVVQAAFMGNAARLLRPADLILSPLFFTGSLTQREADEAYVRKEFYFSEEYAHGLLNFAFAMLFCINLPYIAIFGFFFFLIRFFVDRAMLADNFPKCRASDLRLAPTAIYYCLVVLFIMQLFSVTILSTVKERWDIFGLSIFPMVCTALLMFWVKKQTRYIMGPQFINDMLAGKVQAFCEAPTIFNMLGYAIGSEKVSDMFKRKEVDTSNYRALDREESAVRKKRDSRSTIGVGTSAYVHPAKSFEAEKIDHEAMAAKSWLFDVAHNDRRTHNVCDESVFFSNPPSPRDLDDFDCTGEHHNNNHAKDDSEMRSELSEKDARERARI
ncbi:CSC1-like protein [Diplonema papillatum]|nr:CSC1-like protein [Diplonema papillatum]